MKVPQIPPLAGCTPLGISPNGRPYSDIDRELFELGDLPFNLAGESQSSELTAEAEARVRALAVSEARKAQLIFALDERIRHFRCLTE